MSYDRLDQVLIEAIAKGVLPATAARPVQENRPWPVVLLTALGSWLAAIPLLIVLGFMLSDMATRGAGPYIVGAMTLGLAVMLLRSRTVPLFVEQLGVPAMIVGGGLLGYGVFRDLPNQFAAVVLALLVTGVAWPVPRPWLRVLLGAAAAVLSELAFIPRSGDFFDRAELSSVWFALHVILLIWLVAAWVQHKVLNSGAHARLAAAWESLSVGWLLVILAGLAFWSGMTFLVSASMSSGWTHDVARALSTGNRGHGDLTLLRLTSIALAAGAAAWLQYSWPAVRQVWCAGVALVCIALAWFMPSLGAVLLALAVCVSGGRWRVASAAGLAAAWIFGAFYYQLNWPFATKALVLAGVGAALGGLTWLAWYSGRKMTTAKAPQPVTLFTLEARKVQAGIAFSALAVLLVANIGIWQKEDLIAHGEAVYVELSPVDPRSLMQGDYMRLNFRLPGGSFRAVGDANKGKRQHVIARHDAGGVATLLRMEDRQPLAAGEFRIELSPKSDQWVLVTDAWFFKEGEGELWAKARYGEFRVKGDGRALLVGLRGDKLQAL